MFFVYECFSENIIICILIIDDGLKNNFSIMYTHQNLVH